MASAPLRSPGWVVTSLTRSPPSQTSRSCACSPLRYSCPVRAGMALRLPFRGDDSLERGHHLVSEDLETPRFELRRNESAGVQLGHDAVEAQRVAQPGQSSDHA